MSLYKKLYCLWIVAFATILFPDRSYSLENFTAGPSGACYVVDRVWPDADSFYYCGKQELGCASVSDSSRDATHWLYNGNQFSKNGTTYWCCGGTSSVAGKYATGSSWYIGDAYTVKKDLGGGKTCNQQKRKTVCGTEEITKDCNEPDGCSAGLVFRKVSSASGTSSSATSTGVCVAPCSSGSAFESETSAKCIECPTTNYQGISNEVCLKCDSATQLFAYKNSNGTARTGQCVGKTDSTKVSIYSKTDLQYGQNKTVNTTTVKVADADSSKSVACWVYSDTGEYKNCVLGNTVPKLLKYKLTPVSAVAVPLKQAALNLN